MFFFESSARRKVKSEIFVFVFALFKPRDFAAYRCGFQRVLNIADIHRQYVHIGFSDEVFNRGCFDLPHLFVQNNGILRRVYKVGKDVVSVLFYGAVVVNGNITIQTRVFDCFQTFFANFPFFFFRNVFFNYLIVDVFNEIVIKI